MVRATDAAGRRPGELEGACSKIYTKARNSKRA